MSREEKLATEWIKNGRLFYKMNRPVYENIQDYLEAESFRRFTGMFKPRETSGAREK